MVYSLFRPGGWKNKPDKSTPISGSAMGHIEQGVLEASQDAEYAKNQVDGRLSEESLSTAIAQVAAWAKNPDAIIAGSITRNGDGVITSAAAVWPDGKTGTFTTDAIDATGAINGYHVTRVDGGTTTTYTQPTITRDSLGAATNVPQIVVS